MRRFAVAVLAVLAASAAMSPAAGAEVVASWDATAGRLSIGMTAPGDGAVVAREGDRIAVRHIRGWAVPVAGPTLAATAEIAVLDTSGGATELVVDLGGGRFDRAAGTPRFTVDLGAGPGVDTVRVLGEADRDNIRVGSEGLNLTALEDVQPDIVQPAGVDRWVLEGRGGHDLLSAGGGSGAGLAVAVPVEVVAGAGGGVFGGGSGADVIRDASGNGSLIGGDGNDILDGGGGSDKISAGNGDDAIVNREGSDSIAGGSGRDRLVNSAIGAPVAIDLARTDPQPTGGAGTDALSGIEEVEGTPFADLLVGGEGSDRLLGAGGDDTILGRGGHDLLAGGDGDDALSGDRGTDDIDGGPGRDAAGYASSPGGVLVRLDHAGSGSSSAAPGADVLRGIEDVGGSPHNDTLIGDERANRLDGGEGRDRIVGRAGPDALAGGLGDDSIDSVDSDADSVACGGGRDTTRFDKRDSVAADCEPARRTIAKRPAPASGSLPSELVEVDALTYRGRARRVRVRLRCPVSAQFACRGEVRLRARLRAHGRSRMRPVGRARYKTILSGREGSIAVALRPKASRAVRRGGGRFTLVVLVAARDNARADLGVRAVRRVRRAEAGKAQRTLHRAATL